MRTSAVLRKAGRTIGKLMRRKEVATAISLSSTALLTACGGGGGGGSSGGGGGGGGVTPPPVIVRPTQAEASRFLMQASFGATDADITAITTTTFSDWIAAQVAMSAGTPHLAWMDRRLAEIRAANPSSNVSASQFYESFWSLAASAPDQLRQRVKFALSEIFVISFASDTEDPRGNASYYDMLGKHAFGNFRDLLEDVTYHPAMGLYLTYRGNQKEDTRTGRNPDQNYAREIMQLMTIGLYLLNNDGTLKNDLFGNAQPTYGQNDIDGLAKVFTGLSWYHPTPTNSTFSGGSKDDDRHIRPMIAYNNYHSISAKSFLGTNIPATTTADTVGDVKTALDTLFNHPNVGPFIGKQLIQRLVTSNPSPAYVGRVAATFNNNGSGVRGDMAAVVRAILLDSEARSAGDAAYGKLKEPIVRLANWMRTFEAASQSGNWLLSATSAPTSLGQSPLTSPSVFNFYRPGYVPTRSALGTKGLLAPEFQATDEVSVAGYINTMQAAVGSGIGSGNDIRSAYSKEVALATDVPALLDRLNLVLYAGTQSAGLRSKISAAVTGITIPGGTASQSQIDTAKLNRVKLAVFLSLASPEYIAQR
ncbi:MULTISPECIES: DUF1800 family protein [Asticcacaulis]|uniref:DUF1800 domain-containing protein n=1 Tax=Asticcacaulis TaxID=76890 RepID=UPI001FD87737|nr:MULTISPECIES: DUF1800 domain-containing protein [Asticcacaulis]MBP2157725.1 uncharacterized protein (DUF1800 family) [Asticcacaulis solisilvae]MDR6798770.1 uncharacterized protein (DUF1800 family) [Asticcacaulis sp. BE141]